MPGRDSVTVSTRVFNMFQVCKCNTKGFVFSAKTSKLPECVEVTPFCIDWESVKQNPVLNISLINHHSGAVNIQQSELVAEIQEVSIAY